MSSPASGASWRIESDDRGVCTLWFDQPGRAHNLLDRPAIDELDARLDDIASRAGIRGCVVRSAKPGGFCAGIDLHALARCEDASEVEELVRPGLAVINRLASLEIPTLAVIHGVCLGGGLELALACRRRVAIAAEEPLQAGVPQVHFGLVPVWGGITRLPRIMRRAEAIDMLVTGRSIGYLRARSLGLVDRLTSESDSAEALDPGTAEVPSEAAEPWEPAMEQAYERLGDQPGVHPEVQRRILALVELDIERGPAAVDEEAIRTFAELAMSPETREAIAWFFQRKLIPATY